MHIKNIFSQFSSAHILAMKITAIITGVLMILVVFASVLSEANFHQ